MVEKITRRKLGDDEMNRELALMLSEEVLRLKEESNGTITINEALESIIQAYKSSQGLNENNCILNQNKEKCNN